MLLQGRQSFSEMMFHGLCKWKGKEQTQLAGSKWGALQPTIGTDLVYLENPSLRSRY